MSYYNPTATKYEQSHGTLEPLRSSSYTPIQTSYSMPMTVRGESVVLPPPQHLIETPSRVLVRSTIKGSQHPLTNYSPVYQSSYEQALNAESLAVGRQQVFQSGFQGEQAKRMSIYNPIEREIHERRWQIERELEEERMREQAYFKWRTEQIEQVPPRPHVPLASSYVLQPDVLNSLRQTISNYEQSVVAKLDVDEKFKSIKEDMTRASYTYSQMINTILYNFKEILLALKEIEKCKNELIQRDDFNIQRFYVTLNNNSDDKILNVDTLKQSLDSLNFTSIEINDIELLFSKYSNERSSSFLSLNDFRKIFIPFYINQRRKYELESRDGVEEISIETQRVAARVIKMHLNLENSQEYYRQLMQKRLIDLAYCFDYIDRERRGVLNVQQIHTLLTAHDVYQNPEDVNLLIQRFNNAYPMGSQLEHVIKLNEFIYELSPKSRFEYHRD